MNREVFERLIRHIEAQPDVIMCDFTDTHPCGTVGCIAGNAIMMDRPDYYQSIKGNSEDVARQILGINNNEARALFYDLYWPKPFRSDWSDVEDFPGHEKARKEIMIARIRHFMETGE